jgi:NB-ARC domain/TIR domain/WD domain, G-beta repeat
VRDSLELVRFMATRSRAKAIAKPPNKAPAKSLKRRRVFISYARKDGDKLAVRLQKDLEAKGFEVWLDKQRIEGGANWTAEIEKAIDGAQVVLAILTPGSYVSSICRAEQLRSLRKGKKVIPLLGQAGTDVPLHLESANYRDFTANYDQQVRLLFQDITTGKNAVVLRKEFRVTVVTAPPLPRIYLPRLEALASLRDAVVTDDPGPGIALTALRGMGGIGKTVLAQALCLDEAVQHAFPDGIVWTTAGIESTYDLTTRIQEVRRALGDEPPANESELHCISRYRTILSEKAALIIVDDVWRSEDIAPFLAESPRSKLVFTTRDETIANVTGARAHSAELLTFEQARTLLAQWAERGAATLPPEADSLVKECGRLPLALSMVGAMLRGKPLGHWDHVLKLLRQADLGKIRAQFPLYPYADMLRAIQVSVDSLESSARRRYVALAVLLEDMPAASAVQQTLWKVDAGEALETAEQFVSRSLAQRDGESGIRLHDLQLDYVRARYPKPEALELIHGAVRLSAHVIENDPQQFASQVVGRLLPHRSIGGIQTFVDEVAAGAPTPWLRPLREALHPPGTPLLRTLEGHSYTVHGVAVTADGKRVVSASGDNTLRVWDLASGRDLRTLEGHSHFIFWRGGDGGREAGGFRVWG